VENTIVLDEKAPILIAMKQEVIAWCEDARKLFSLPANRSLSQSEHFKRVGCQMIDGSRACVLNVNEFKVTANW